MSSPCCSAPLYLTWGLGSATWLCSSCWKEIPFETTKPKRDLIAWVMQPRDRLGKPIKSEAQPPYGERVFYRHGKRLTFADRKRGKPDAWFWIDA